MQVGKGLASLRLRCLTLPWVKVFWINPEFRILTLTFHRKSASKCWIKEIIIASSISFQINTINHFNFKLSIFVAILQILKFEYQKFRILEILNFHPCNMVSTKILYVGSNIFYDKLTTECAVCIGLLGRQLVFEIFLYRVYNHVVLNYVRVAICYPFVY